MTASGEKRVPNRSTIARVFCRIGLLLSLLLLIAVADGQTVARAYVGQDAKAHMIFANGAEEIVTPEPQQVGCLEPVIARDKRTVAWSVLVDNCCTSYPVATAVVVHRNRRKVVLSTGQMIYGWQFVGDGKRIAVLSGPVHGSATGVYLYDSRSGKLVAMWQGKGKPPKWAERWKAEFDGERASL